MPMWLRAIVSRLSPYNQPARPTDQSSERSGAPWAAAIALFCSGVLTAPIERPYQRTRTVLLLVLVIVVIWTLGHIAEVLPGLIG